MKASPDKSVAEDTDVDTDGVAIGVRSAVVKYERVIEIFSSDSETGEDAAGWRSNTKASPKKSEEDLVPEDEDREHCSRRGKSKKKHKKHHHHDKRNNSSGDFRKKYKKQKIQVDPIFLWAQKRETKIVRVVCESIDSLTRLRLVKKDGVWTTKPRSKVLESSRSSVCENDDDQPPKNIRSEPKTPHAGNTAEEKPKESEQAFAVDVNDNPIGIVEAICSEEDEEAEQRARIDRALEMIEQDPTLLDDVKIMLPTMETATIKLPEGTTIHQVKAEHPAVSESVSVKSPPVKTPVRGTYGELTIISQQQNEPLNLETVGKRSALEIRLQQPPLKKKRMVVVQPAQRPRPQSQLQAGEPVKREWGPLSELKEVLSDPGLSVPDPLLVPRARLAALVASPATEIPKLLQTTQSVMSLPPPPPDPDLLAVSLSHLRSIMQQQPGFTDERDQQSNIDQMLWLSYLSKDMTGADAELLLSLLLPPTADQQSFNYAQQKNQWNDVYYGGNLEAPYSGSTPGYNKSDDCCASVSPLPPLLPLNQQQQSRQQMPPAQPLQKQPPYNPQRSPLLPPVQPRLIKSQLPPAQQSHQKSRLPQSAAKQRVCREMCCTGSPSSCYENCCCPKATGYNPFAASPAGCNPFAVSPTGYNPFVVSPTAGACGGNPKACTTYSVDGATCCFPVDMGYGYGGGHQSPSPILQKQPSVSPGNRVQYGSGHAAGPGQQRKLSAEFSSGGSGVVGAADRFSPTCTTVNKPAEQTPLPGPAATASPPKNDDASTCQPLQKPKIKVKKHLIDLENPPKLLNIEGALHLAGANPQDLLSSPLWHPLFGR